MRKLGGTMKEIKLWKIKGDGDVREIVTFSFRVARRSASLRRREMAVNY